MMVYFGQTGEIREYAVSVGLPLPLWSELHKELPQGKIFQLTRNKLISLDMCDFTGNVYEKIFSTKHLCVRIVQRMIHILKIQI